MKGFTKKEKSWILYDWANSAYTLMITTAIMPLFFTQSFVGSGGSKVDSVAYWGYGNAIATLLVSLLAPILGTIADYRGMKMKFFKFFLIVGVLSTFLLTFIPEQLWWGVLCMYIITAIGFSGSNIFYDATIVDVTTDERMDKVSSAGFGYGYIGSVIPFIMAIGIILAAQMKVIPLSEMNAYRASFLLAAVWWWVFSLPMLRDVDQLYGKDPEKGYVKKSFKQLWETIKKLRFYKEIMWFLVAYFFYIDGVGTIIKMATSYGASLGVDTTMLILILLAIQIVAFPFAILFGRLAEQFGGRNMLYVGILVYIVICIYAYFLETTLDFWILSMLVASAQGGIQALSRSYFAKIIPKEQSNEFFGFYNIFGKFAAVIGPLLVGVVTQVSGQTKVGVLSVAVLFIIGGAILFFAPRYENVGIEKRM